MKHVQPIYNKNKFKWQTNVKYSSHIVQLMSSLVPLILFLNIPSFLCVQYCFHTLVLSLVEIKFRRIYIYIQYFSKILMIMSTLWNYNILYDVVIINNIHQFNETQYNSHECSTFHNEITSAFVVPGVLRSECWNVRNHLGESQM